jgi:hypothetical protein
MQTTSILSSKSIVKSAALALVLTGLGTAGILSGAATPRAAHAADRPGTPIDVMIASNAPWQITVSWVPTASEDACIEFQITQNGQPVDLHAGCVDRSSDTSRLLGERQSTSFNSLDYNSTYCFQVRARDWNDGDPGSGYVSEVWSNPVCAEPMMPSFGTGTPAQAAPDKPARPTIKTAFPNGETQATLTWSGEGRDGDISYKLADWYTVQYKEGDGTWITPSPQMPALQAMLYVHTPPPSARSPLGIYTYRICAGNAAGISCSDEVLTDSYLVLVGPAPIRPDASKFVIATPPPPPHGSITIIPPPMPH